MDKNWAFAFVGKFMTEFSLSFNALRETHSETGANICTLPTYHTHTMQLIAIYGNTSVQFDEGTPLLPNSG
jgi:hypothetical protein